MNPNIIIIKLTRLFDKVEAILCVCLDLLKTLTGGVWESGQELRTDGIIITTS